MNPATPREAHILVFTPYPYGEAPGPRSSIELWEKVLEPAGLHFHYATFGSPQLHEILYESGGLAAKAVGMARGYGAQLRRALDLDAYDAVLIYREAALIGPEVIERIAGRRKPLIYQLDDPLYVPYRSPFNGYLSYLKFFGKVKRICSMSSCVIVNSPQHREYASRFSSHVWEIPSLVDAERYIPRSPTPGPPVRLGWSGSLSTVDNLSMIDEPLREVVTGEETLMSVIGADQAPLTVPYSSHRWSAETEIADLSTFDIGLVPLPANPWNERKFFLKLVQYMALGIPAVATPMGANPQVLEHGATGYLAETAGEWARSLEDLVRDEDRRAAFGERAAEVAHARYTLQANAERIVTAIRSALS